MNRQDYWFLLGLLLIVIFAVWISGCTSQRKCQMICNAEEVILCSPDCAICPTECTDDEKYTEKFVEEKPLPDDVIGTPTPKRKKKHR